LKAPPLQGTGAGTALQGFLILNVPNSELLVVVSGCFVNMAAENSEQTRDVVLCLVLGLLNVPETSSCFCNLYRIWRTWRQMKKQTLRKMMMMMSRKSKRMNC